MDKDAPIKRRLFVGTFLPKESMDSLGELSEHDQRLHQEWQKKLRWVRPEKMHLTWLFLGGVEERLIPEVQEKLSAILEDVHPMDLQYAKPTFWPSPRHARTLVIEPNVVPSEVHSLAKRMKRELGPYAEKIEHEYRPHITLMRMDEGRRARIEVPDWFPLKEKLPLHHHIERIDLIESDLAGSRNYQSIWGRALT